MLGRQVRFLQLPSTVDFTNEVHRPRLASPPFGVFPSTGPPLPRPPIRYCIHCSSSVRLCTNSCPRVVPNSSSPNPVPHAQYSAKVETSENKQEVKTARELRAQARLAVPSSNSSNPGSPVRCGVEVVASKIRTARWPRKQAGQVVPNSSPPDPVPHDLVSVEIEASQTRTARELREQARRVVTNSSCPDPVPHSRHDIEAGASANAQEMKKKLLERYGSKHDELFQIQVVRT